MSSMCDQSTQRSTIRQLVSVMRVFQNWKWFLPMFGSLWGLLEVNTFSFQFHYIPTFAGILFLYFICLRLSKNDWIGSIPPGPCHLPYFGEKWYFNKKIQIRQTYFLGCFFYLTSKNCSLDQLMSGLFLQFGSLVKFGFFRKKIILVDGTNIIDAVNKRFLGRKQSTN